MLNVTKTIFLSFVVVALSTACKKKDDNKSDTEADTTEKLEGTEELSPVDVVSTIGTAVASAADAGELNPGTLQVPLVGKGDDTNCDPDSGGPKATSDGSGEYAGLVAYCNLIQPSSGPDTTQGAIARIQGFLCALGDRIVFDDEEHDLDFEITEECFPKAFTEMANNMGLTKATVQVTGFSKVSSKFGSTDYNKSIHIKSDGSNEDFDLDYKLLVSQTETTLAGAIQGGMRADAQAGDYFAIFLDRSAEGAIRYEGRFYSASLAGSNGGDGPIVRHTRTLAKGAYDADKGEFTSISDIQFLNGEMYSSTYGKFVTVKGNHADGYKAMLYSGSVDSLSAENYTATGNATSCYGDGDCSGNDGITITSDSDMDFIKNLIPEQSGATTATDFFLKAGPLSFDEVTTGGEPE